MNNTNITFRFLEKIERADSDFNLFDSCKKILVGLSGGADSTSLAVALSLLSEKMGFKVFVLHVNHMIRGAEADRDEEFSRLLCEKIGVEFFCERLDIPEIAKKEGISLELCARNERYKCFERICRENGITHVATAHNACDNAETVIFNLVRGSGMRGLCGIPAKRELCDGITVVRPLICTERGDIEAFLESIGQSFVTDSTNEQSDYTRNYIRHSIIPLMRNINPKFEAGIVRTSRLLKRDEDFILSAAKEKMTDDIPKLKKLNESILSRVVVMLFSKVSDEMLSEMHIKMLCDGIYSYNGAKTKLPMPMSMSALLYKEKLSFVKDERKKTKAVKGFECQISEGCTFFEENPYALYISFDQSEDIPKTLVNEENIYKKYTTDYLCFDTIPYVLFARNRRDGDKIFSSGMNKSVKRIMSGKDYDENERYLVPFLCTDEKILLIPGLCVCDECKKSNGKKECISVSLYKRL